jgi:hypothetical protein
VTGRLKSEIARLRRVTTASNTIPFAHSNEKSAKFIDQVPDAQALANFAQIRGSRREESVLQPVPL